MRQSRSQGAVARQGHVCVCCLHKAQPGIVQGELWVRELGWDRSRDIPAAFPSCCRDYLRCVSEGASGSSFRGAVPAPGAGRSAVSAAGRTRAGFGQQRITESK